MLRLEEGSFGWDYLLVDTETGEDLLIQTDWDYPGVASTFGWSPCTGCRKACKGETDGTIDCARRTAGAHISSAQEYLDKHIGDEVDDPGYFGG